MLLMTLAFPHSFRVEPPTFLSSLPVSFHATLMQFLHLNQMFHASRSKDGKQPRDKECDGSIHPEASHTADMVVFSFLS